jgi:hypothetical protein
MELVEEPDLKLLIGALILSDPIDVHEKRRPHVQ